MCNVNSDACRQSEGVVMRPPISPTSVDLFMDNWERILSSIFSDNSQICWWHPQFYGFMLLIHFMVTWMPISNLSNFFANRGVWGKSWEAGLRMFQHVDETLAIYINEKPTNSLKEWSSWAWAWYTLTGRVQNVTYNKNGREPILTNPLTF